MRRWSAWTAVVAACALLAGARGGTARALPIRFRPPRGWWCHWWLEQGAGVHSVIHTWVSRRWSAGKSGRQREGRRPERHRQ
jgi:hypothetical protein